MTLGLVIVRGGPSGTRFDLHEDAIIGRIDAGIRLDDDEVSRVSRDRPGGRRGRRHHRPRLDQRHVRRRPAPDRPRALVDGSVVRVGQTELRVETST